MSDEDTYSVEATRAQLGNLIDRARDGRPVIITSYRRPVARLVGVRPTRSIAELTELVDSFDIVTVIGNASDGYEPRDAGRIAVQQDGQFEAWAGDLDDALDIIGRLTGVRVKATEAASDNGTARWTVT
ncbi:type II toxin-antitoxin system prevent-host-death family antitoxin [Phytomonospora sp. NPDC050363]|uniref:type II toxin-antitoxin system Phd/YefM family antitoxin n=1 Tax=Phytomonospora sp. NPDC050363 TaxID=3155642 RepID=UPI0033CD0D01